MLEGALRAIRKGCPEAATEDDALFFMVRHLAECQVGGLPGLRKLARRYPIHERDRWRCMVPGCSRTGRLHRHHIVWRSKGGTDDAWVLISVCSIHHDLIHEHGTVGCWLDWERVRADGDQPSPERVMWGFGALPGGGWRVTFRGDRRVERDRGRCR